MLKSILCIAGGVAIGYYLAHGQLEQARFDGYNEGFEEGKEYYKPSGQADDCEACAEREEQLRAMTDEEFAQTPEVLEAAAKAAEALQEYQGIAVAPDVLAQEMDAAAQRDIARGKRVTEEINALRYVGNEEMTDAWDRSREDHEREKAEVPEQPKGPVNYNEVSTPQKPEPKKRSVETEVITQDEFVSSRTDCKQFSITYFAGDDILAGEHEQVLEQEIRETYLGEEVMAMLKAGPESWGGGVSLFIRNTTANVELDIAWSSGRYVDEVGPIETTTG